MRGILQVTPKGEKRFRKYALFSMCEYQHGILRFKLNPDMTDFLLKLKGDFSKPLLSDFLQMQKHADWVDEFLPRHPELNSENVMDILKEEVGKVFVGVLEDAGVYKCTEEGRSAFAKFMETL